MKFWRQFSSITAFVSLWVAMVQVCELLELSTSGKMLVGQVTALIGGMIADYFRHHGKPFE